jgi:transcriptional regulator with XRE-family HTH domain
MTPDAFRAHLKRRGYSNTEFAEEMGVERRTVGRWASGKNKDGIPISVQMLLEGRTLSKGEG